MKLAGKRQEVGGSEERLIQEYPSTRQLPGPRSGSAAPWGGEADICVQLVGWRVD